jgi:chromosome partitioning protein
MTDRHSKDVVPGPPLDPSTTFIPPAEPRGAIEPPEASARSPVSSGVILAIANQKGGVGKTTTAVNLAAALAERGQRVLVVDLDPQGNASTGLGIGLDRRLVNSYRVLAGLDSVTDGVVATSVEGLSALPSTIDLAGAEIELVGQFARETRLDRALAPARAGFDVILVDCPPSLGLLTVNALTAADGLVVPIQCEYYALEGLGQLLSNVGLVRDNLNPRLQVAGILLTMFDRRTRLAEDVVADVREHFGPLVYDTIIPRSIRLSEAPGYGQPITTYDPGSTGARAYRQLAAEVQVRSAGLRTRADREAQRAEGADPTAGSEGGPIGRDGDRNDPGWVDGVWPSTQAESVRAHGGRGGGNL